MINPVNNNPYNDYRVPQNKVTSSENSSEHFSLGGSTGDAAENGVIYERSTTAREDTTKGSQQGLAQSSYTSTLDTNAPKQESGPAPITSIDYTALFDRAVTYIRNAWNNILKFVSNLWESKPIMDGIDPDLTKTADKNLGNAAESQAGTKLDAITSSATSPYDIRDGVGEYPTEDDFDKHISTLEYEDEAIKEALAAGDKDRFRSIISDGGKRMPAHSTTLLTTYDASGKIVNLDPSDENKILHGDRNSRKF